MLYTFDTSRALSLALVATEDLSQARYLPLADAPAERRAIARPYLRQLHAIANSEVCGLIARQRSAFDAAAWEGMSA